MSLNHTAVPVAGLPDGWRDAKLNFGLRGDGVTDDSAAFQAMMTELVSGGGTRKTVYWPAGTYLTGGAFQDTGNANSQIVIPNVSLNSARVNIKFVGPINPLGQFFTWSPTGIAGTAVIKSTRTGGTGTAAVIAGTTSSAVSANQNNVSLSLENLVFECPPNPTLTAVNLQYHQGCTIRNVLIHAGTTILNAMVEPTNTNATGIKLPMHGHTQTTVVDGLTVFGFYVGIRDGEIVQATWAQAWGCKVGMDVPFAYAPSRYGGLAFPWCPTGVRAVGGAPTNIKHIECLQWNSERANGGSGQPWQNIVADVDDPSNWLRGEIRYVNTQTVIGVVDSFVKVGGTGIHAVNLNRMRDPVQPEFVSAEVGLVDASTVEVTFSEIVKATSYTAGVTITVGGSGATINSATRQADKTKVRYALAAPVAGGAAVTIAYEAADGFITDEAGNALLDVTATAVTNTVPVVLVLDAFTDANGTALASHTISPTNTPATSWSVGEGSFAIQGNKARASTTNAANSARLNAADADVTITVTVRRGAAATADLAILFRYDDDNNYWIADLRASDSTFQLLKKVAGVYSSVDSEAKVFAADTDYVIEVVLSGNSISATVDGGSAVTATDAFNASATRHGIWAGTGATLGTPDFNDFTVEAS